jgi:predicted O-methyltransferase YrrM
MYVPIETFAIPSDISIFGGHFGQHTYYASFAGIAKKYAPQAILEIGVRFGYSAIAMCLGAIAGGVSYPLYMGLDACFFSHPNHPEKLSNEVAGEHFRRIFPNAEVLAALHRCDTRQGLASEAAEYSIYNLINVDGDHSYEGCYRDLVNVWPLAAPGAIVIVDDTGMEGVKRAIEQFRDERTAAGDLAGFQWYDNERGFGLLLKEMG